MDNWTSAAPRNCLGKGREFRQKAASHKLFRSQVPLIFEICSQFRRLLITPRACESISTGATTMAVRSLSRASHAIQASKLSSPILGSPLQQSAPARVRVNRLYPSGRQESRVVTRAASTSGTRTSRRSAPSSSSSSPFNAFNGTATMTDAQRQEFARERAQQLVRLMEDIVGVAVKTGPRGATRFVQGVQAVAAVGSDWLLQQIQAVQQQQRLAPSTSPASSIQLPGPAELRRLFERLGATYIKLGQFIASAPSLFPPEYVTEFQTCLDKTPPVPFATVKGIIERELKRPLGDVYEFVDPTPLASASIAQVHAARLKGSGAEVVVKVVKPGVEDTLTTDLNFVYVCARVLEFLNPSIERTSLVGIVQDIRASMMEEVDMGKEARNLAAFSAYLDSSPSLRALATCPRVYTHASSTRVLTMERVRGVPLTDLDALKGIVPNPEATLIAALNVWFGSLFACDTFHADVHAGNLLVRNDGRVAFIDFGIVGRVSPDTWASLAAFLASIGSGDYTTMATALIGMGATADGRTIDTRAFANDLRQLFEAVEDLDPQVIVTSTQQPPAMGRGMPGGGAGSATATVSAAVAVDEQQINTLLLQLVRVSEGYGLRFPREFGLLLKQLLYFDRYTRLLAPSLNVLDDARVSIRPPPNSSSGRGGPGGMGGGSSYPGYGRPAF
ncbi:unnamed protein product [Closterium sp. Yama58-4]|nr:unnamed protein product [Closterium sp. Yama58-4]